MARKFQNFIDGTWVDAISGKTFENRNPANWDEVVGTFPKSGKEDVEVAVRAARRAFEEWRLIPAPEARRHPEEGRRPDGRDARKNSRSR